MPEGMKVPLIGSSLEREAQAANLRFGLIKDFAVALAQVEYRAAIQEVAHELAQRGEFEDKSDVQLKINMTRTIDIAAHYAETLIRYFQETKGGKVNLE